MEVGHCYIIPWCFNSDDCTAEVFYASEQVVRFRLKNKAKQIEVEKHLLIKSRQPWKILNSNFEFTGKDVGVRLTWLFKHLNRIIKEAPTNEQLKS